jgi:hypothetical protein
MHQHASTALLLPLLLQFPSFPNANPLLVGK